jgi:hypothetical protein
MELVDNVAKAVKKFMTDRATRLAAEREALEAGTPLAAGTPSEAGADEPTA